VVVADIEENAYWKVGDYCDEFHLLDLRYLDNCLKVSIILACFMPGFVVEQPFRPPRDPTGSLACKLTWAAWASLR
jgi:hypothetical protein